MTETEIRKLIAESPALQGKLRGGDVEFRSFDQEAADRRCAHAYVIPFVSDTDCLVTRRANGKWVLPGGTLEPGESWAEASHRELLEETGSRLGPLHPIGMYDCFSREDRPRRSHLPHPEYVRVVSWADAERVDKASDPDPRSTITEVRAVHYREAAALFDSETPDFRALYLLAFQIRQRQPCL